MVDEKKTDAASTTGTATAASAAAAPSPQKLQLTPEQEKANQEAADREMERQRRAAAKHKPFVIAGRPGQAFTIKGEGFGTNGTVRMGDVQVATTRWGNNDIRGEMPLGIEEGTEVIINPGMAHEQRGEWPDPVKELLTEQHRLAVERANEREMRGLR